jgi:mannose-1-phosphate guanylyltransferase
LPGNFGWDDIGLWSTVFELGQKDEHGTVAVRDGMDTSPVLSLDAKNNLVATNKRLVALLGVEDLVVIDSTDVLLVLPRSRAADVKKIVQQLESENLTQYL